MNCSDCPLLGRRKVHGRGSMDSLVLIVGEAPGKWEEKEGRPFVGDSGKELDKYLRYAGLRQEHVRIENVVKCRPSGNKTPSKTMIDICSYNLFNVFGKVSPRIVVTLGVVATQWFLGPCTMEYVHGIPYDVDELTSIGQCDKTIVIPTYHPAAALRNTAIMTLIQQDFQTVGDVLQQKNTNYRRWPSIVDTVNVIPTRGRRGELDKVDRIAIDTETREDGSVICFTYSVDGEVAYRTDSDEYIECKYINSVVNRPGVLTIMHNALFDLPKLNSIGIYPAHYTDTMSMAYLLQDLPKGLKVLSYRLLNFVMASYSSVIGPYTQERAVDFLSEAIKHTYPDPEPIAYIDKSGDVRVKQPQSLNKLLNRALNDFIKNTDMDLYARLSRMDFIHLAEKKVGPLRRADISDVEYGVATQYAGADAIATYKLYDVLWPRIVENRLESILERDMGIIPSVVEMQSTGFYVDVDKFHALTKRFSADMMDVEDAIHDMTGCVVNINSPKQVAKLLYKQGVFKTPEQSTSSEELDLHRVKNPELIGAIGRYRELKKLISTYTEALPAKVNSAGRITTDLSITRTSTGRLASSNPNLMNIPKRTKEGAEIRKCFIATPGCVLLSNDYSQIEMRMAAHMSQDQKMLQIFEQGVDIHSQTASWMFDVPMDKVDKMKHRYPAKRVGFGILYGLSAYGLAKQFLTEGIEITEEGCQEHINRWFAVFEGVAYYMEEVARDARRYQRSWDMFGRYRLVPEVLSVLPRVVNAGLRQAGNNPIQSGAQGVIKEAMRQLYRPIQELRQGGRYTARFIIQIHDDLVFEVSEEIREEAQGIIKSVMENVVELVVDTPVDSTWAYNWGEL